MDFFSSCYLIAIERSIVLILDAEKISVLKLRICFEIDFPDLFIDLLMLNLLKISLIWRGFSAFLLCDNFLRFSC